jgi:putative DNA primase/helicase
VRPLRESINKKAINRWLIAAFHASVLGMGAVSGECFESASRITAWHLSEAQRFFGELALPAELADAMRLDNWLIEYCRRETVQTINKRYLQQHGPVRDGVRLDAALMELIQLDRLRVRKDGRRVDLELNPALLGVQA